MAFCFNLPARSGFEPAIALFNTSLRLIVIKRLQHARALSMDFDLSEYSNCCTFTHYQPIRGREQQRGIIYCKPTEGALHDSKILSLKFECYIFLEKIKQS